MGTGNNQRPKNPLARTFDLFILMNTFLFPWQKSKKSIDKVKNRVYTLKYTLEWGKLYGNYYKTATNSARQGYFSSK
jgi:hypothetical protein